MALLFPAVPLFSSFPSSSASSKPSLPLLSFLRRRSISALRPIAASRSADQFDPSPSDNDPPEVPEDSSHGVSRFSQFERQVSRARRRQDEQFKKDLPVFLQALADEEDPPLLPGDPSSSGDDLFGDIDRAIALKRQEFVKQGLLPPNPSKNQSPPPSNEALEGIEELAPEEVVDLEEIQELQGLTIISDDEEDQSDGENPFDSPDGEVAEQGSNGAASESLFDLDVDAFGRTPARIFEPKFKMTLAELLDESPVVPISVYGDLEISISGIQHDPKEVTVGDLFVCCNSSKMDGHDYLTEADKRGAVALVADEEINIEETLGCKALVIVEDTSTVLRILAASFYRRPSNSMSVIGVGGTHGKATTSHLVKAMYDAMGLRTGMLGTLGCYVHGENRLDDPNAITDAVVTQKMMAKMVHNGTEAVVMEVPADGLAVKRYDEIDFDIAVFTNLTSEHPEFVGNEEEYRNAQGKLFAMMVDPERHRKVVNIDDPNAPYFVAQGNPEVPFVTYSLENKNADVHTLKFELSLFETQVLVQTPNGILEISSGLLGRHNIYNILAAVSVGIAVGAPLEDIVRGIEEVDAVPGRCELIDEEQAFGVVVDHAKTPEALSRLLDAVRELGPRRIITVIGCEGEQERGKRPLMTKIATDKSDVVMLTSDNPRNEDTLDILDDMLAGVGWTMQDYLKYGENDYYPPLSNGHRLFLHDIRRVAVRCAVAMGEEGDVVSIQVVAGKGHETYQIEGDKKEFLDDREDCREALQYVDELHQAGIDTSEFPWRLPESH
ncbi:UDP-N-acetylmuramoyl-L-alanyl-D-glutamate--2,6-diaminopimelate ligase MurE homolog, chloroplastic-like isoform X1 [Zingiber officinale]|uniref:UDP-N-acetylmuramoyl-L-alanyl-D-glutamate--2, 6-diaminopimelate ligase MurE homolog, chloroplastic-like isoform X1 n=1 Tax=Zingiber officinale TaxID=94328 RepID=UPI001C4BFE2C|nr:UDP-N-acetylmuramoyl-L-alanyl-D-glutamate--2,6-diaminopimelate ligase MurE homolog, chloroplastic-like isoform X1 [Zingiber officinale]